MYFIIMNNIFFVGQTAQSYQVLEKTIAKGQVLKCVCVIEREREREREGERERGRERERGGGGFLMD